MKKATIYFTEQNARTNERKNRSKAIEIPDELFNGWKWDAIVKIFRAESIRFCSYDSNIIVKRIKLGRTILHG